MHHAKAKENRNMFELIEQFKFGLVSKQNKHKGQKKTLHDEHGCFKFKYKRYEHEQ